MDNSKSPLLELLRKHYDDDYQPKRLYNLLDEAKALLKRCFKHKGNEKYARLELDGFSKECQWAKGWIRDEHAKNPALSVGEKDRYLKDWVAYIDRIYQWLQSSFRKGKADFIEYERLQNIRDGLFERSSIFYQAAITQYEDETKRLRNEIRANLASKKAEDKSKPQRKAGQGSIESGEKVRKITKLTDFIINCCEDTPSISSKANRIHEFIKKRKIKFMPKTVNNPKGNETKLYYEEELRQIWPKLKEKIKSLPNLKD